MASRSTSAEEAVRKAQRNVAEIMRRAGYDVGDGVEVKVDPRLPFMGYSHPLGKGFQIVVSGGAVNTGMLEGLLAHEMSHIYRMERNHPSHNGQIIQAVIDQVGANYKQSYQQKILGDLVNNIEDLYADDISFKILKNTSLFTSEQISSFLQDWVQAEPAKTRDKTHENWLNAWIMANNARAIAQMQRHKVEDIGGEAASKNKQFLSQVNPSIARNYEYFRNLLANMKENITEESYREFLTEYLDKFIETAEAS